MWGISSTKYLRVRTANKLLMTDVKPVVHRPHFSKKKKGGEGGGRTHSGPRGFLLGEGNGWAGLWGWDHAVSLDQTQGHLGICEKSLGCAPRSHSERLYVQTHIKTE